MYDAAIGRFHTIDPLADFYPSQSPYVYAANNPVRYIDYMGLSAEEPYPVDQDGTMVLPVVTITATRVEPKKNFLEWCLGWLFAPFRNYEHKQKYRNPLTSENADGSNSHRVKNRAEIYGHDIDLTPFEYWAPGGGRPKGGPFSFAEFLKKLIDIQKVTNTKVAESESVEKIESELEGNDDLSPAQLEHWFKFKPKESDSIVETFAIEFFIKDSIVARDMKISKSSRKGRWVSGPYIKKNNHDFTKPNPKND